MGIQRWMPGGVSRNPFLFRGPIPTALVAAVAVSIIGRNPFLFRGPIPTHNYETNMVIFESQSLLIQRSYSYDNGEYSILFSYSVAIPSYSEVLFLL